MKTMEEIKMICFGARENEAEYFRQLNRYNYQITLVEALLTEENIDLIKGHNAVMLRGNCIAKQPQLEWMRKEGVEYLLTRTVGYDHIDLEAANRLDFKVVANVPGYSPNAISELAVSLAMMLVRNTAAMTHNTAQGDFTVYPNYFSREVRLMTVGVIGVGKIGLTTATLFKGLGSKVIGYDLYQSDAAKAVVEFKSLDELIAESDLICLHMPYIKDQNYHFVDAQFIQKMRDQAILINCGRGELVDLHAMVEALTSGKLAGFGTDVLEGEGRYFNKNFQGESTGNADLDALMNLYPRALITPHIGSNTDEACRNMVELSYENIYEFLTTGHCSNELRRPS